MVNPRWLKVLRDLWINKTRTLLVVLSIAVGVFAVGMIAGSQAILSREMTASYAAINPSSALLGIQSFDDELIRGVRGMREIQDTEGRRVVMTRIKVGSGEWLPLELFAYPDYDDIRVNKLTPERGAWPPPERALLVERAGLGLIKSNVGDVVLIDAPGDKQRELRIAGTVHDPIQSPSPLVGIVYGYVTFDTLEWLGESQGYGELVFTVAENKLDKAYIQAVANRVRDKVEKSRQTVDHIWIPTPGKHPADDIVQAVILVLAVLGFLSLVLSGFLVTNTISALLMQQIRQIGVMKAIGAQPYQMAGMYLGMALVFGLLALVIGMPAGALGASALARFVAGVINFDIASFSITPQVWGFQIAIGLMVPCLAALHPIISSTRITVRGAMSTYGLHQGQPRASGINQLAEVTGWAPLQILSRPVLLSLRNTFRRKGRLALTLIALTLGSATFVAVLSVHASVSHTLDEASRYWQYDIEVNLGHSYRIQRIEREALSIPGVVSAEGWGQSGARRLRADGSESDNILLIALPPATDLLQPIILQGRWVLPNDENAIVVNTDLLRDETDIKIGDEILLKVQGREIIWQVVGIVKGQLQGPTVYVNYTYFERVVRDLQSVSSMRIVTKRHDQAFQSRVAKELEQYFKRAGLQIRLVMTTFELRSMSARQFNIIVAFLLIMAILMGVVGGIGLMGTMTLNVFERTREIGVMRAIGASDGAVLQIVIVEGVVTGVLSWLMGTILALPLSRLLSDAVGVAFMRAPLSYAFSINGVLLWLVLVSILAALASYLPARNASRVSVREALMYE